MALLGRANAAEVNGIATGHFERQRLNLPTHGGVVGDTLERLAVVGADAMCDGVQVIVGVAEDRLQVGPVRGAHGASRPLCSGATANQPPHWKGVAERAGAGDVDSIVSPPATPNLDRADRAGVRNGRADRKARRARRLWQQFGISS